MVSKYRILVIALMFCLAWAVSPRAQAKNTLICTMVDESDKPIAKQEFTLTSESGKQHKKKTNEQGEAKFGGLDDGTYTLSSEIPGFVEGKSAPMEVSGNAEKPCKYTLVSAAYANGRLKEVMSLIQQKKFAEAEATSKKLVEMMPGEGAAYYVLAVTYAYEGKEEAIPTIKKAVELAPDKFKDKELPIQMQALNQQAENAKQKKDFPAAIQKYETMLSISPNDPTVLFNMAVTYAAANELDKAITNIDKVLVIKPDDAEAKQLKARLEKLFDDQINKKLEK
ncbi:MAG: tetratricopeptide repeat protein [Acidobacteria bacterium]|nr:tetratricopeptide repeat protein [Acidobacteriota bacterium]